MAKTAAVTGVTGFIGSHVARTLIDSGWQVRALVRRMPLSPPLAEGPLELVIGSLEDRRSLRRLTQGVDAVVHVAGLVRAGSRAEFFRVNASGVRRLAEAACAEAAGRRFILISSVAAREPMISAYAASKRGGEIMLCERGAGLEWTILRPPAVYGPGDKETLALLRWIARGLAPMLGPEGARFSLLHVSDLATAIALILLRRETIGRIYELDDGTAGGYSWRSIAEVVGRQLGALPWNVRIPRLTLQAVAACNSLACLIFGRREILTLGKVRELHHLDWVCDNTPICRQTGWQPAITFSDGLAGLFR